MTYPALRVTRVASGLDLPWDVKPIGNGRLLITERSKKRLLLRAPGRPARARAVSVGLGLGQR